MPSRFMFFALAPFLLIFIVAMPLLVTPPTTAGVVILWGVEIAAVCLFLGLLNANRFGWQFRVLGGLVFLGYASYLVAMLLQGNIVGRGNQPASAISALAGFIVIGIPGLMIAIRGARALERDPLAPDESDFVNYLDGHDDEDEETIDCSLR